MTNSLTNKTCKLWWLDNCFENEITDYLYSILDYDVLEKFVAKAKSNVEQHAIHFHELPEKVGDFRTGQYAWTIRYPGMTVGHLIIKDDKITDIVIYDETDMKYIIFTKDKLDELKKFIGWNANISLGG